MMPLRRLAPALAPAVRRLALLAAIPWLAGPAHALVAGSSSLSVAAAESSYGISLDAVAELSISTDTVGYGCSGTLLAGGQWVLTAAHCVSESATDLFANSISITLEGGATATVSSSSQILVFEGWSGTLGGNDDVALLWLDTAITSVEGMSIASDTDSLLGSTVILAGYGLTGSGSTGAVSGTFGTLHAGTNRYDSLYGSDGTVLMDFDNGNPRQNASGSRTASAYEAGIASGDSGGPSFAQTADGEWVIVGVHSFGMRVASTDIDGTLNSSFGELAGDTVLWSDADVTAWVTSLTAVPEPEPAVLMLAGALILWTTQRRRNWASWSTRRST